MAQITIALIYEEGEQQSALVDELIETPTVGEILLLREASEDYSTAKLGTRWLPFDSWMSGTGISKVITESKHEYILFILPGQAIQLGARALARMLQTAEDFGAGLVYSDFRDDANGTISDHPLIDYQLGSIRDSFDFGSLMLVSQAVALRAIETYGAIDVSLRWGGFYDLRLRLSLDAKIHRIPEPLYTRIPTDTRLSGEKQFDYVDPRQREYQLEMEAIATAHLKRLGAFLEPEFHRLPGSDMKFSVRASIVIPVRNRERTIHDAVSSALSQKTDFPFTVIVVDNHSTDKTTAILAELAERHDNLVHLRPIRTDLGIGGCWNEAIFSEACGEYAVQLDSDDLYKDEHTLAKVIAEFGKGEYAMVIGSYTVVNFELQEIPPGIIDHKEWTRENGRNNALRINGLGAPRAFWTPLLRQFGLPNTSYGEDYATALRISRQYEIGRLFESIYYARRWEGNSDAALPLATANRYDFYKDYLRSVEIVARKKGSGET